MTFKTSFLLSLIALATGLSQPAQSSEEGRCVPDLSIDFSAREMLSDLKDSGLNLKVMNVGPIYTGISPYTVEAIPPTIYKITSINRSSHKIKGSRFSSLRSEKVSSIIQSFLNQKIPVFLNVQCEAYVARVIGPINEAHQKMAPHLKELKVLPKNPIVILTLATDEEALIHEIVHVKQHLSGEFEALLTRLLDALGDLRERTLARNFVARLLELYTELEAYDKTLQYRIQHAKGVEEADVRSKFMHDYQGLFGKIERENRALQNSGRPTFNNVFCEELNILSQRLEALNALDYFKACTKH